MYYFELSGLLLFLKFEKNMRLPVTKCLENLDEMPVIQPQRKNNVPSNAYNCVIQSFNAIKKLMPGYQNPSLERQVVLNVRRQFPHNLCHWHTRNVYFNVYFDTESRNHNHEPLFADSHGFSCTCSSRWVVTLLGVLSWATSPFLIEFFSNFATATLGCGKSDQEQISSRNALVIPAGNFVTWNVSAAIVRNSLFYLHKPSQMTCFLHIIWVSHKF